VDGFDWVQQRKSASREFSVSRFRDSMLEVFAEGASELMGKVDQVVEKGVSCDIQDLYFRLTLKSFAKIAFGLEVDTFSGDRQPPFAVSFDICTRLVSNRFFDMFWELKKFLNIAEEKVLLQNMKVIDDFVYRIIRDRRSATSSELSERCDMLSQFLTIKDEKGNPPSDKSCILPHLSFFLFLNDL
jgi:cytochrome P450